MFKELFNRLRQGRRDINKFDETVLAEAAIMAGLLDACNRLDEKKDFLTGALARRFELPAEQAQSLTYFAIAASKESVDAFQFAHHINQVKNVDARADFIRLLWDFSSSAELRPDFAANYIERIAHLFDMTGREAINLRGKGECGFRQN